MVPISVQGIRSISLTARVGSLSRAAEALSISQPALSRRISDAEHALGVRLFERMPRGVKPTEACTAFLRHAEVALTSINDGLEAARDIQFQRRRCIGVGMLDVFCDTVLMAACEATRSAFEGTSIQFATTTASSDVSAQLLTGELKLGLRYRRDTSPQLEAVWLADDPVIAACAPSHPLAAIGSATMEQLECTQWIGSPLTMDVPTSAYLSDLTNTGFQNWKIMAVSTIYSRIRLIEAGIGVGMVRRACIWEQLAQGKIVELQTPLNVDIPVYLAWRSGSYLGEAGEYLRDQLIRNYHAAVV